MLCPFGLATPFRVVRQSACWTKFFKLVRIIAYLIQKELCKNIPLFSWNNFWTKFGRAPATPLTKLDKIFKNILDNSFSFSCNNFLNKKMGVTLPRPFGWSGMLDETFKNILDHSLFDAKAGSRAKSQRGRKISWGVHFHHIM